ncbi:NAD(P)-binding protein [Polyplosphaeria fusca]|uniref:NAD(P)-binding protein n=1 Tax=Polyplosphaeria fusca TaxID=682080 RepID=A0A9P4UX39_9PLEO|nr:NAD(P)-binding protein [Polyplosphaeria fusca]
MASNAVEERQRTCYASTDPRTNKELAKTLNGKNILIAGGGRGIGKTMAEFFSNCSPVSISLAALEQDEIDEVAKLCKTTNPSIKTKTQALDVRDTAAVEAFVEATVKAFGGVDVAIMNAGRPPQWLPLSEGDPSLWWHSVEVGIRGSYNFARYVLPVMQTQKSGTFILTASGGAHGNAGYSAYTTAKLAMVRLAEIVHAENFKEYGIKAFAISPGAVPTRMYTDFKDKSEGRAWDAPELSAGMAVVLSSGKLDFLSGRYVDCGVKVEKFVEQKDSILSEDLHRVRLNAGLDGLLPTLPY